MPTETYEVTLTGNLAGNFVQNILHIGVNNVGAIGAYLEALDIADTLNQAGGLVELWCTALPTDYTLKSMKVRRVLATGGPTAIILQAALAYDTGLRSGTIGVSSNSPLLLLLTTLRPNRLGRIYMPGVAEADIAANVLAAGLITDLDALGAYWQSGGLLAGSGDSWDGQVLRRELGVADAISDTRVSQTIGQQRRRQKPN